MLFNTIFMNNASKIGKNVLNRRYPFISRSATTSSKIETVDMAYSVYDNCGKTSTKPPLLVFHALFGSKNDVDHISKEINQATSRKVIAVDARNHGDSPHSPHYTYFHVVADVIELLKKLELNKVSVLGHCMGGHIAMVLALTHPNLVSSLAIEDIAPGNTSDRGIPVPKLLKAVSTLRISSDVPMTKAVELAHEHLKKEINYFAMRKYLINEMVNSDTGFYRFKFNVPALEDAQLANNFNFPDLHGSQYTGPTLFIAGSLSNFIRNSDIPQIREYFPSAEITYIDGVGHGVHYHKPVEFLEVLCKFLTEK